VVPSFFLPAYRAYTFINVSPHPLQPPDAHLPPSNTVSFLECANVLYFSLSQLLFNSLYNARNLFPSYLLPLSDVQCLCIFY
jgi:hypothetical protein